jgi:hypothetical protein
MYVSYQFDNDYYGILGYRIFGTYLPILSRHMMVKFLR